MDHIQAQSLFSFWYNGEGCGKMKFSTLVAKLREFDPESQIAEIDVLRLFTDDSVKLGIEAKFD